MCIEVCDKHARIKDFRPGGPGNDNVFFALFFSNSVGRCVIPLEFLGKSVKHTFSCRKMYSVYDKRCFQFFSCRFNVIVTSQSDVPIYGLFRA